MSKRPVSKRAVSKRPVSKLLCRSLGDLLLQVAGFMIAAQLAQRGFVQLRQNLAQGPGVGMPGAETLSIHLAQRLDGDGAVLGADGPVVAAIVETGIAHGVLRCA